MTIKDVLMQRDGLTESEALDQISNAKADLWERLAAGECPDDICQEHFGLEPDFIEELIF